MTRPSLSAVLYLGSKGPDVERLQQALADHGFYRGDINGMFSQDVERAVQDFQRSAGLRVDGTVSPEVRAALFRDARLEQAAQAAIHASVQATAVPGGVGVGQVPASDVALVLQSPVEPPRYKPFLILGGLVIGGLLLAAVVKPKPKFGDFEDDNGLPPMLPGGEEESEEEDDALDAAVVPASASETDIVPFGGGVPLKRGAGGKFLPRNKGD